MLELSRVAVVDKRSTGISSNLIVLIKVSDHIITGSLHMNGENTCLNQVQFCRNMVQYLPKIIPKSAKIARTRDLWL